MSARHEIQTAEMIAHLAGEFLERESNGESLITVTRAEISPDLNYATVFISAIPDRLEQSALEFAKRQRSEFRQYLRSHSRIGHLPTIDFELDFGEKNRQRIDELTRQ